MVFAVQCPNPQCRKFMLVEEHDRNKVVNCLICKTPIRIDAGPAPSPRSFFRARVRIGPMLFTGISNSVLISSYDRPSRK